MSHFTLSNMRLYPDWKSVKFFSASPTSVTGANIINLFLSVSYGLLYLARVFVRLDRKKLTNEKYSSLLRKSVIYGQKKFYNIGPGPDPINPFYSLCFVSYTSSLLHSIFPLKMVWCFLTNVLMADSKGWLTAAVGQTTQQLSVKRCPDFQLWMSQIISAVWGPEVTSFY